MSSCLPPSFWSISSGRLLNLSASNSVISNHFYYFCSANHFYIRKKRTRDEGLCPRSCGFACVVYKVIGVTYINRPGAFLYPPVGIHSEPSGFIQSQVQRILLPPSFRQGILYVLHCLHVEVLKVCHRVERPVILLPQS